jgi:predicted ArsR family transcriptional regulator
MRNTRQSILEYLERKPFASAMEISQALRTSVQNIRHHLGILFEQGAVEVTAVDHPQKRGRPTNLYALTRHVHEHNLDQLTGALLDELLTIMYVDGETKDSHNAKTARNIALRLLKMDQEQRISLLQRLVTAVQSLNEMNYHAHWEAHPEAPRVILGHCPYLSILPDYPWLCQMDRELLNAALLGHVEQVERLAPSGRGTRHCVFVLKDR